MKSLIEGIRFLTRIPLGNAEYTDVVALGKSVSWFPLIGGIIGIIELAVYVFFMRWHMTLMAAFFTVLSGYVLTGAMHADGFMDTCDGYFSGRSRERSLEIMKDPHAGVFGICGVIFLILGKFIFLEGIDNYHTALMAVFTAPILGRLSMALSASEYPYARPNGIGRIFSDSSTSKTSAAVFITSLLPAILFGFSYLILLGISLIVMMAVNRELVIKFGGLTGDTYGAVSEITEFTVYLAASLAGMVIL